jgi:4-hydroxyphenylpyruvate dioxygenase
VLDSFHSLSRGIPSSSIAEIRPEKLFIVQVADAPMLSMDHLSWSRHFRMLPGQGEFPLADYVAALKGIGYDGWWSLEIFNDRFRASSAAAVAQDGLRSLYLFDEMGGGENRLASTPRIDPQKIAFIEFAASHEEADALGAMLRPLGFAPTARHRSKDVTRWTQEEINIIVNCEPEGLAHSFDIVHGASVCAIGLSVADPQIAMRRAEALSIPRYEQAVAPDEWPIPSVRGLGGSLVYFVESASAEAMWAHEFPHAVEDAIVAPNLIGFDHLAFTMQFEEFLSGILFHVALFDMIKTPQLEIADPMGLVQSQAVESAGGGVRITMNGSQAHQSLPSRFLQNFHGAGVQHIAFATNDIFAAVDAALAAGVERLPIPPNYYDDLDAKYDLPPDLLAGMAARDILYDRDGEAEYFQFYTRAFARRVFFEIVERRDYRGYGAINAPIRLAAQARFKTEAI